MLARPGRLLTRWNTVDGLSIQPVAYWNLDEESGTRVDSIGSLDLTDNNSVLFDDGVGAGQKAAAFVAANTEYLSVASDAILQIGDRDWTLAGWFYMATLDGTRGLFGKGGAGSGGEFDALVTAGGAIQFRVRNAADSSTPNAQKSGLSAETWYFLECGYSATDDELFIRIDNGAATTTSLSGGTNTGTNTFALGALTGSGGTPHNGREQSFGIFHGLLTDADRTFLYNGGNAARLASGGSV